MKMKIKIKKIPYIIFILLISSLINIKGIYGLMTVNTVPAINTFTLQSTTSYTVVHELMNMDGTTYTLHSQTNYSDIPIGTVVTPEVLTITGFNSPVQQTVTLNTYNNTVITYRYIRKLYNLTINDSTHVTTTTPSGTYYYGQEIHLIADQTNGTGNPFVKWTDNTTNRDYTFTLTDNTTIGPIYANSCTITYVPNNGDPQTTVVAVENQPIGTLPTVVRESCVGTTGSYHDRGCTEAYEFQGWYLEPTFDTEVNGDYVITASTTLYAKWHKIYFGNAGPETFDGTNYINTGIPIFSEENADRDFIVTFTVDVNNGYPNDRGTIFTDMSEKAEPYQGLHFFYQNNTYTMNVNIQGNKVKDPNTGYITGQSIVIKKENGIVSYSYDNGPFVVINDFTNFNQYFNNNATFGAGTNSSGQPYRYFDGTLSDMSVQLSGPKVYKIHYDANGGTGMMVDQSVKPSATVKLTENAFTNGDSIFSGWNTQADGSGTSYTDKQQVTGLGNVDDVITLYAQWVQTLHYSVHFDANGGTGTMNDQQFIYNDSPVALTQNAFTKAGYQFVEWNTQPDGNGTSYKDLEEVQNLTNIPNGVVTLYAQFMKVMYSHTGDKTFDGTVNDFIDTGVNLYSSTTVDNNFEIRFTVKAVASDVLNQQQPTIINCKDESNPKWPGFNIRFGNNATLMVPTYKWNNNSTSATLSGISTNKLPVEFVFKRKNKTVTLTYSYQGFESQVYTLYNQDNWTLTQFFPDNISFGGIYNNNHQPDRFFKGTLSDMIILMDDSN